MFSFSFIFALLSSLVSHLHLSPLLLSRLSSSVFFLSVSVFLLCLSLSVSVWCCGRVVAVWRVKHMCAWCPYTQGRFERTHGDVLSGHTGRGRESSSVLLTKICPYKVITCFGGSTKKPLDLSHFQNLRIGREQHVPDSSNHSFCLIKLLSFSYPEGHVGGNQL